MLKSKNLTYEVMKIEDVYQFKNWGSFATPLLKDYNFIEEREEDIISWYYWKTSNPFNIYYTIFKDNIAIGYIGFKNRDKITKSATLGIVLNPDIVNKGYGTEILNFMFDYYFNVMNYKKIYLKVAKFNKRAIALYKKIGFRYIRTNILLYDNGDYDEKISDYKNNKDSFKVILGRTFFYAYKMVLNRKDFNEVV